MPDAPKNPVNLPLSGKLVTSRDGTMLAEGDFQLLRNMRYGEISPKSIGGMSKINTSAINATYLKPRAGFHFRKSQPSESHALVQSWNTGLTASRVYENTTAIPSQGDFTATALWTDTTSANVGKFSDAPDGCMVYANGVDCVVWGGNEYRCGGFLVGDLIETVKYDYTDKINNTLSDSNNVAILQTVSTTIDANTMLLLHLENNVTDSSPTTVHTVTNSNMTFSTSTKKFGTYSGQFNGTTSYCSIPDNADFDLSAGTWTVDLWVQPDTSGGATQTIYHQRTDATHYMNIALVANAGDTAFNVSLIVYDTASEIVSLATTTDPVTGSSLQHIELVENGDSFYIFVDGALIVQTSDASRAANYTGTVYIGADYSTGALANFYKGYIDEYRLSNTARHSGNFTPPTNAYGSGNTAYVYVASTRPIKGAKFYISTANASTASADALYWASTWHSVSNLVDGTSAGGITLSATGSITFDSTVSTAKTKIVNGVYAYWYLFTFTGIDSTTAVYYVTLDAPVQQIVDIWDGNPRPIMSYFRYVSSAYTDETTQVLSENYVSGDSLTYSDISSFATASSLICGFAEKIAGIDFTFVTGKTNSNAAIATIYYWNGSSWVSVGTINDGTRTGNNSFAKSGTITWDAISEASEFKNSVSNSELWYYYKISFSAALSANIYLDYITGIPAQKTIKAHSYPVTWQNRIWLLDEYSGKRNGALCSAMDTVCVFNGSDSTTLYFGNDEKITSGATLFTRFGGSVYDNLIVLKESEAWIVDGSGPSTYQRLQISDKYGCVAPRTLIKCDMGYTVAQGLTKHILIWQADNAICMFDGNTISPISGDISNYFDPKKSECIPAAMKIKSEGFYDEFNYEYHFLFASGTGQTTLNKEFVYDLLKKKWFEVPRSSGKQLQMGFSVRDTNGQTYTFGGLDTGYIERLENGTTFDGDDIVSRFRLADIAFGGWNIETLVRGVTHIAVAKATTTNTVSMTHYGDVITTSGDSAITFDVNSSTHRVKIDSETVGWGNNIFHSFDCSMTTSNENIGYEPIGISVFFEAVRRKFV